MQKTLLAGLGIVSLLALGCGSAHHDYPKYTTPIMPIPRISTQPDYPVGAVTCAIDEDNSHRLKCSIVIQLSTNETLTQFETFSLPSLPDGYIGITQVRLNASSAYLFIK